MATKRGKAKVSKVLQDPKAARIALNQNQSEFWSALGVTQSGGSRYENGRGMPTPLAILMVLREQGLVSNEQLEELQRTVAASR